MKKVISIIIMCTFILSSFVISVHAGGNDGIISGPIDITEDTEIRQPLKESYTLDELYSILAGDHNFDIPEEGLEFTPENFPLDTGDASTMTQIPYPLNGGYWYIVSGVDGSFFASNTDLEIFEEDYDVNGNNNSIKWAFHRVDTTDYKYVIRPYNDDEVALEAVMSDTAQIYASLEEYYSSSTFHWRISVTNSGIRIISASNVWPTDGANLDAISGTDISLSHVTERRFLFLNIDVWRPCTTVSIEDQVVSFHKNSVISSPSYSPSNADHTSIEWFDFDIPDGQSTVTLNNDILYGNDLGSVTLTVRHKLTKASDEFTVYVGYPAKVRAYYDNAFVSLNAEINQQNSETLTPAQRIESWMKDVTLRYGELNISLELLGVETFVSYPEQKDEYGNYVCAAGGTHDAPCVCSNVCENSQNDNLKEYHHKNSRNIFYRLEGPTASSSEDMRLYFTGHRACKMKNGDCTYGPFGTARREENYSLVFAENILYSVMERFLYLSYEERVALCEPTVVKTITHEIGHLFANGLDHYEGTHNHPEECSYCIYGEYKNEPGVVTELKLCDCCSKAISDNSAKFN